MTILVLNVTAPAREVVASQGLARALGHLAPQILVFAISFINLGVLWVGQHNQYHFIRCADRWFIWINIGYLMLISFIPFATALLGQYPFDRLAIFVYGATIITAELALDLHWRYASSGRRLVHEDMPATVVRLAHRRILTTAAAYAGAIVLSLLSPLLSLGLFLVVPFINIVPFGVDRHLKEHAAASEFGERLQ